MLYRHGRARPDHRQGFRALDTHHTSNVILLGDGRVEPDHDENAEPVPE